MNMNRFNHKQCHDCVLLVATSGKMFYFNLLLKPINGMMAINRSMHSCTERVWGHKLSSLCTGVGGSNQNHVLGQAFFDIEE